MELNHLKKPHVSKKTPLKNESDKNYNIVYGTCTFVGLYFTIIICNIYYNCLQFMLEGKVNGMRMENMEAAVCWEVVCKYLVRANKDWERWQTQDTYSYI